MKRRLRIFGKTEAKAFAKKAMALFALGGALSIAAPVWGQVAAPSAQEPTKPAPAPIPLPKPDDAEVRLGRENAEAHDKEAKFINDPAIVERVRRIGTEIAAVANSYAIPAHWGSIQLKQFNYVFKVVDDKDVNAYCMPAGFVYVNKGLLDIVRSDDELAGVLAHEIAHAAHHHVLKILREQAKIQRVALPLQLLALLAAFAGGGGTATDIFSVWQASQLYTVAKLNTYGVEAEKDADETGIRFLMRTKYNPIGLYSFMIRLAALERKQLAFDLGIYRTHPPGEERVTAAKKLLDELKLPIHLSEVDPTLQATVHALSPTKQGTALAEIRSSGVRVCRVAALEGVSAEERAKKLAKRLDRLFDAGLSPLDIQMSRDKTRILARGQTLISLADAEAQEVSLEDLVRELKEAAVQVRQRRQVDFAILQ